MVPHVELAIKVYFKQRLRAMSSKTKEDPLSEFGAMQYLGRDNRYVMGQLGAYHDGDCVYSVMEFCYGGELYDMVAESPLEETRACRYFLQILMGLEYCHSMGVAHRDMSLENVMYDQRTDTVKIIDFGMCLKVPRDEATELSSTCRLKTFAGRRTTFIRSIPKYTEFQSYEVRYLGFRDHFVLNAHRLPARRYGHDCRSTLSHGFGGPPSHAA